LGGVFTISSVSRLLLLAVVVDQLVLLLAMSAVNILETCST